MSYEINVAIDGQHLFATHARSLDNVWKAQALYELFLQKFPAEEGYTISVSERPGVSYDRTDEFAHKAEYNKFHGSLRDCDDSQPSLDETVEKIVDLLP